MNKEIERYIEDHKSEYELYLEECEKKPEWRAEWHSKEEMMEEYYYLKNGE